MSVAIQCDGCDRFVKITDKDRPFDNWRKLGDLDMCPECYTDFVTFLTNKRRP